MNGRGTAVSYGCSRFNFLRNALANLHSHKQVERDTSSSTSMQVFGEWGCSFLMITILTQVRWDMRVV